MRTLRIGIGLAWGMTAASAATASAQGKEPYPGLDAYITKALDAWKIPGLGVAIVRNDSVIYAKGFGVLGVSNRAPVNEKTLFEIGSSSKAFTATLVAMLVSDGKMRYDDRLTNYLPDFRLYDPIANEAVTLRDALTHRSGIARGEFIFLGANISRDEVVHRVRFLKPESPFRSRWSYQNIMYVAAGQAAGKAGGKHLGRPDSRSHLHAARHDVECHDVSRFHEREPRTAAPHEPRHGVLAVAARW